MKIPNIPTNTMLFRIFLFFTMFAFGCYAGPLVTAAAGVNSEITQAAAAVVGAILVVSTIATMGSGGARMLVLLLEVGSTIYVILNPSTITGFFRFGG